MERTIPLRSEVRVWQDERLGKIWRIAYRQGDEVMVVSFPDVAALDDFIDEQFGLDLLLEHHEPARLAA
ncbi:MAG: hypothetical protein EI684_07135 [Candidatus Viridilinea halotolerans]|uniref:Uncharacterized protein n=1 Tax=Candidatus Viridilinea halotolerans TaxID=2491704 RepID=A0A426U3K1_9CHLR|nr:MAG: hypothetical protein EI684_07135 [Candidatus Viridilinea halotolerans]